MLSKRWLVAPPVPMPILRRYKNISPILAQILYNRGLVDPQAAQQFLFASDFTRLNINPFLMKDMRRAVDRIFLAIQKHEPIVVYGDFDADGVTSTTLMMQVLTALGANARAYIPHRVDEGYGLNTPALQQLAKEGARLIVTVDCGIRSVQEIEDGKAAGLDIIITDHHSIGPEIPAAYAVVNPQQEDCPGDTTLAGVGVAFMVAYALLSDKMRRDGKKRYPNIKLSDLLDLVAIGTIADIMPLNSLLNRVLVRHGLETINEGRRLGIAVLCDVAGLKLKSISAMNIGFVLAPRINAAGRLESAMIAYRLLSTQDEAEARSSAQELQRLNTRRQDLTRSAQDLVRERLEQEDPTTRSLIFAGDPSFVPGIVGLVAGRLTEEYYRPAVILEQGEEESHASCRSIPQFNITQALDECADLLVRHGGHAMAAGLTVVNENIPVLRRRLTELAERALEGQELVPTLHVDMELEISQMTEDLVHEFRLLEPTGHHYSPPVFMASNLRVMDCRTVGSDNNHLKLRIGRTGSPPLDAIGFGLGEWAQKMPNKIDVVFNLEINEWNGKQSLQLNLQDLRPAERSMSENAVFNYQ